LANSRTVARPTPADAPVMTTTGGRFLCCFFTLPPIAMFNAGDLRGAWGGIIPFEGIASHRKNNRYETDDQEQIKTDSEGIGVWGTEDAERIQSGDDCAQKDDSKQ
jgi:hypothetical protein